jgi:hypothetical protein
LVDFLQSTFKAGFGIFRITGGFGTTFRVTGGYLKATTSSLKRVTGIFFKELIRDY